VRTVTGAIPRFPPRPIGLHDDMILKEQGHGPWARAPARSDATAGYIGSSSSSFSASVSCSSVPHIGRAGAGLIGEGVIGGRPGVRVPSVVCSEGAGRAAARRGAAFRAGRRAARRFGRAPARDFALVRFAAPVRRRVDPAARRLRVERADERLFAAPVRLRRDRVEARFLREDVLARFFRRVLLAIRRPPLTGWPLSHGTVVPMRAVLRRARSISFPHAAHSALWLRGAAGALGAGTSDAGGRWAVS
jgi:hypothetical protein